MDERYCSDPSCRTPIVQLSTANEMPVRSRTVTYDGSSTYPRTDVGELVLYIHQSCFTPERYYRAG